MRESLDNRDTQYTIDTYSIFNLDSEYEYELQNIVELADEYGLPDNIGYNSPGNSYCADIDDYIEFDYDMDGYRESLANASIEIMREWVNDHAPGVVNSIELESNSSPQFYNFTTDSYTFEIDYDKSKLQEWVSDNLDYVNRYFKDRPNLCINESWRYIDTPYKPNESAKYIDDLISCQLLALLDYCYDQECKDNSNYLMDMFDRAPGYEFISWQIKDDKKAECDHRLKVKADLADQLNLAI